MELLNGLRAGGRVPTLDEIRPFVVMLGPIAPHLAEEMWERLGGRASLFDHAEWPSYDEAKLVTDTVDLPVQVNGKLRGTISVARGADEETVRRAALADDGIQRHASAGEIAKVIYIPDRLLNLVVQS
jgi:leucyl-tRNA synthetase